MTGLADHVALHAKLRPDRLAAVDLASDRRWTYAQLDRAIGACAALLVGRYGGAPGDRVACLAKNRVEFIILHLACARAGLIFVPLNWRLSDPEIADLIGDAAPVVTFGDAELERRALAGVGLDELDALIQAQRSLVETSPGPDQPSLILYTSGTSGRPKGVLLSERNMTQTAINFGLLGQVEPSSVFMAESPMFHVIGLVSSVRPPLMFGGTVLVSDGFQPGRTLARMSDQALGVTHYFCVPQMAAALRRDPGFNPRALAGLKAIFTGGAPHPAADIQAFLNDGIPIADGFGMSEAGTVFGMPLSPPLIAAKVGCVGVAPPAVLARIVDAEGRDCGPGEAGELLLKGENIFSGYWRRPEETRAAFTEDGWFRSGDIAVRDEDGFYRLVDRKKDMFISGGENVYPAEIENALSGMPGLLECAVIGVADAQWGEVGVCCFVADPDHSLTGEQIHARLSERLARYKLPKSYLAVDRLPRTGTGKVVKSRLRDIIDPPKG
ncbi:MAG: AMP-binding protein [Caulobacteraceae bacterium]|nr:AMP-binding protein [Caulobacteraceae bacterium]